MGSDFFATACIFWLSGSKKEKGVESESTKLGKKKEIFAGPLALGVLDPITALFSQ